MIKTNCPNCGAPLKDRRCEHCGTQLTETVRSEMSITSEGIYLKCHELNFSTPDIKPGIPLIAMYQDKIL